MSQEGGQAGEGKTGEPSLWDAQAWAISNSDNSAGPSSGGGGRGGGGSDGSKPAKLTVQLNGSCSSSPAGGDAAPPANPAGGHGKRAREDATGKRSSAAAAARGHEGKGAGDSSDHEIHIWTERERRKKMRNMFTNLHALLPQVSPKADKSTIVDEAVNYIKALQLNLQKLEKQKLERMRGAAAYEDASSAAAAFHSAHGSVTTTPTASREAFMADQMKSWPVALNSPTAVSVARFPRTLQTWSSPNVVLSIAGEDAHISICAEKKPGILPMAIYALEKHKLEVVSATISSNYFRSMIMIHAHASVVSDQFPETLMIEEVYKLAVGEMILWLSSQ